MKKSLLTVLLLAAATISFESNSKMMKDGMMMEDMPNGMTAQQQEKCRKACLKHGSKWDPTSAASGKGCTCVGGDESGSFTITDADLHQRNLDNQVSKTRG